MRDAHTISKFRMDATYFSALIAQFRMHAADYVRARLSPFVPKPKSLTTKDFRGCADGNSSDELWQGFTQRYGYTQCRCAAHGLNNIKRIRFGSLEPHMMTDEIIAELADNKRICRQFHLSLQSGLPDTVLERMRRGYTSGQ